jgi:hypothetical protein
MMHGREGAGPAIRPPQKIAAAEQKRGAEQHPGGEHDVAAPVLADHAEGAVIGAGYGGLFQAT